VLEGNVSDTIETIALSAAFFSLHSRCILFLVPQKARHEMPFPTEAGNYRVHCSFLLLSEPREVMLKLRNPFYPLARLKHTPFPCLVLLVENMGLAILNSIDFSFSEKPTLDNWQQVQSAPKPFSFRSSCYSIIPWLDAKQLATRKPLQRL